MAGPTRRQFLRQAGRGAGLAAFGGMAGSGALALLGPGCRPRGAMSSAGPSGAGTAAADAAAAAHLTFSSAEFLAVSAVCERLLPRDQDPGAIDLGVPGYIDRALADPAMTAHRDLVLQILPILDRQSRIRHGGRSFAESSDEQKDALLAAWQRGRGGDRRFFDLLLSLTLEGAFGDPRHGGNRGGRGFALIGFAPGPPMTRAMAPATAPAMVHPGG